MKKIWFPLFAMLLLAGTALVLTSPVQADNSAQVYYATPTPDADGRILYVVQENDNCLGISLLTGVDINTLRTQNNLDEACSLMVGQKLLLGTVQEPTATEGPAPTETPVLPTPTAFNGSGQVCIYLFNDINGNAVPDGGETQLGGGAVSLSDNAGKVSLTGDTQEGAAPLCYSEIPEGDYNISVAPPEGFNSTTAMNFPLVVKAGDSHSINFGAQVGSQGPVDDPGAGQTTSTSPLLAILGGMLLLGGVGLGIYVWRMKGSFSG